MTKDELTTRSPARSLINGDTLTEENVGEAIDLALEELNETDNNLKIDAVIKNLLGLKKLTDFSLSKLWYGYEKWWVRTGQSTKRGDTFVDYMEVVNGIKPLQLKRYISVWRCREEMGVPDTFGELPLTYQVDISTKLLEDGFDPDEGQWDELLEAQNTGHLSAIIRKIKGTEPTKGSYVTYLERSGDIVCYHQDQRVHVGFLKRVEDAEDALERRVLEKMKSRAINGMGLIEH